MREEIRLGNDALARNDLEAAKQHFQQLLDHGGTPIQEQIASNRLWEIQVKQKVLLSPSPSQSPTRRQAAKDKKQPSRTRKTSARTGSTE